MALQRAVRDAQLEVGLKLQALRRERGLTQEQAAEAIGISVLHVRRIEHATTNVTLELLVACAYAYGVALTDLFDWSA